MVFPDTAMWWLEFYRGLAAYLSERHRLAARLDGVCWIYGLGNPTPTDRRQRARGSEADDDRPAAALRGREPLPSPGAKTIDPTGGCNSRRQNEPARVRKGRETP